MKKIISILLITAALAMTLCSCMGGNDDRDDAGTTAAQTADTTKVQNDDVTTDASTENFQMKRGEVKNGTYTNSVLDVEFTPPAGWRFFTDEELAANMNVAADIYSDPNIFASAKQIVVIDCMAQDPLTGDNVNVSIENLVPSNSVNISMDDYVAAVKANLNNTVLSYTFGETENTMLAGIEYTRVIASASYNGVSMTQYIYLRKIQGYVINITATSVSGMELTEFERMFS